VALDLGSIGQARQHLTESIRLSHTTGSRIGVARGLEAFAALAAVENRPEMVVRLTAAASALREEAGFPALAGARVERYLASARTLGEPAIARLWAQGLAMGSDAAVALALSAPQEADGGRGPVTLAAVGAYEAAAPPGTLTPREREVAALVASGRSNKAIADELVISPATAARHVANILAKLGFSSRVQIAAWATDRQLDLTGPGAANGPAQRATRRAGGASQQRLDDRGGLADPGGQAMTTRSRPATTRRR
jgi:DNA-binding NarL/FixJ family response regulator